MIGWVISRTLPQKEWKHAQEIAEISKSAPIPTYVPVQLFYRNLSRYAQARKPVRELIAPRLVFVQASFQKIKMIRAEAVREPFKKQLGKGYFIGQHVEGAIDRVQRLRHFEGFVLANDGETPYVIPHDTMTAFMIAVDRTNLFVEQMEAEALGRITEAKKSTWLKLGEDIRARLNALVGILPGIK